MAFANGGRIVTSGLSLALDTSDPNSYISGSTTWTDLSGNSNNGLVYNNIPPFISGSIPYMDFTSNIAGNTYIASNKSWYAPSTITLASSSFTIELWINRDSSSVAVESRESLFTNTGDGAGFRFGLGSSTNLYYLIGGFGGEGFTEASFPTSYPNLTNGTWHQVGAVFDIAGTLGSTKVYSFVDGVISAGVNISPLTISMPPKSAGISYGCCSTYKGKASKILYYNRALTASEILQNYNASKSRFNLK